MTELKYYTITAVGGTWDVGASLEIEEDDFAVRHQDYEDTWCKGEDVAKLSEERDRLRGAVVSAKELIVAYGGIDGYHHKAWVLDQVFRCLCGETYDAEVAEAKSGEDGPDTYEWDTGVAP